MKKSELSDLLDRLRAAYNVYDTRPKMIEKIRVHYDKLEVPNHDTIHRIGEWSGMTYGELEKKDHYVEWTIKEVESAHVDDPPSWQLVKFYQFVKRDKSKDPKPPEAPASAASSSSTRPPLRRGARRARTKEEDEMSSDDVQNPDGSGQDRHDYLVKALSSIMERLDRVELSQKEPKKEPGTASGEDSQGFEKVEIKGRSQ